MTAHVDPIRPGSMVTGPTLPERIEVLATVPMGAALKVMGRGVASGLTYDSVLSPAQLAQLTVSAETEPFDGDARLFRLGVESHRLGLAYEYKAVMPRFGEMAPQNKLFFRRIVREYGKDWPRYVRDLNALSDDDWSDQVGAQIVEVAHIAVAKHQLMRRAAWLTLLAFVLWRLALLAVALLPNH